jgi:hypothetical protein
MRTRLSRRLLVVLAALAGVAVAAPIASATGPLQASKTATAKWTKTYEWTIEKTVAPDSWDLEAGQSGTSTYTVKVTRSLASESIWVEGEVCVKNVGTVPTENLKIVDRLQAIVGSNTILLASVPLDMSLNPVLDPGESQCYPYSIPLTPIPGAEYVNNARITITNDPRFPGEENGPNEKVDFSLPVSPTETNASVNVDDTNGLSWLFTNTGQVSYTKTFRCKDDEGAHVNTATIRETGQSDDASVTVICRPPKGNGCTLTPGYWKTHSIYGPAPYDPTWALIGENTPFFSSGQSWYQVLWTAPKGNPYYQLSFHYIAARLNLLAGASSTPTVNDALASATAFFATTAPSAKLSKDKRADVLSWAETLALYNEGDLGPGHCG